ncbi:MAG TPA: hypothetical protein VGC41_11820, partial [Kofleriaceae bacterium]
MADKDEKNKPAVDAPASKATPTFDPKPVTVGGESLIDRIYPHRKKIGIFILLGFGVWAVIAIVIHFRDSGREKSTDKLVAVIEVGERKVTDLAPPVDPTNPTKTRPEDTFKTAQERANGVLDVLAKQNTNAAGSSYKASLLVQAGKLDDAIAEYKKGENAKGIDGVVAREGLGLAQEMKAESEKDAAAREKGLNDALATFSSMQPDDKGPRYAYSLYHQGRVLALLGKTADAKAAFDKAKDAAKEEAEL